MAQAINVVYNTVFANIPPQVIQMAMYVANKHFHICNNSQEFIMQKVIRERVLDDLNLTGGKFKKIILKPEYREEVSLDLAGWAGGDGGFDLYRVPPEARDNLPMIHCIGVQYPYASSNIAGESAVGTASAGYDMLSQADQIVNSYTLARPLNHPTGQVLSGDLIKLFPSQYTQVNYIATVRLALDETFEQVQPSSVETLAKMVTLATKAWIYNNLIIDIDRAAMECGADVGKIKEIIEEYRDANQLYDEQRPLWFGAQMLDSDVRQRLYVYSI